MIFRLMNGQQKKTMTLVGTSYNIGTFAVNSEHFSQSVHFN